MAKHKSTNCSQFSQTYSCTLWILIPKISFCSLFTSIYSCSLYPKLSYCSLKPFMHFVIQSITVVSALCITNSCCSSYPTFPKISSRSLSSKLSSCSLTPKYFPAICPPKYLSPKLFFSLLILCTLNYLPAFCHQISSKPDP